MNLSCHKPLSGLLTVVSTRPPGLSEPVSIFSTPFFFFSKETNKSFVMVGSVLRFMSSVVGGLSM